MGKKSSQGKTVTPGCVKTAPLGALGSTAIKLRAPESHAGIQVNFCKNPVCMNFGVPFYGSSAGDTDQNRAYRIAYAGKGFPLGFCISCNESFPLKSNKGIHQELERMRAFLTKAPAQPCCPVESCSNHTAPASSGKAFYSSFGITCSGSQRFHGLHG
jgi:hypothetical protein